MNQSKNKQYLVSILKIAVPIMLGNIINQVQMLVDKAFLGHVNDMYLSALGNVSTLLWTSMSVCFSLSMGASILISQNVGAGKSEETQEYAAATMKWANLLPFVIFLFWTFLGKYVLMAMGLSQTILPMCEEYMKYYAPIFLVVGLESSTMVIMQTSNYTKPMAFYGIVRAGLNVILDYIMIFGKFGCPAMGIKGAAIATAISEYAGVVYAFFIFSTSKKLFTRPKWSYVWRAKFMPYFHTLKLGVNSALEDFAWNFGNLMMIRILNAISEKAAGIYSIVFSVELLVVVIVGAIGNATMILSGEAYGAKDRYKYKHVCMIAYSLTVCCALVTLGICLAVPEQIVRTFTNDATIIPMCCGYLILMCINLYGKSANIIIGNGIRGSGDTRWMFFTQIFGTFFVIGCALLFVFVVHLGIAGVFLAVIADEIVRACINLWHFSGIARKLETA